MSILYRQLSAPADVAAAVMREKKDKIFGYAAAEKKLVTWRTTTSLPQEAAQKVEIRPC